MNQTTIEKWFSNNIPKSNEETKKPLFKKYFYLSWKNYDDYNIYWSNTRPIKFNFEKKVKLIGYK